jgi:exopolyphosphatase/guanosine-5'-triphosphate,3'-diphosphate pyrophosphatase
MRVAVVDIGTNSTRLLVAEVLDGAITELDRRSIVTRLGQGVDASGHLADEAMNRVFAALDQYAVAIDGHGCERRTAVMTSAVRDAANGAWFADQVRGRYALDGATLSGTEEARLTYMGATAALPARLADLAVVDIGGGSTEVVAGREDMTFFVSMQVGVVRFSERHLHSDPPTAADLAQLREAARQEVAAAIPAETRAGTGQIVAVAGTATMCAAMDLELEPYRTEAVEGHVLSVERLAEQLEHLASLSLAERRNVKGLNPDRAPTIVAGVAILSEVLAAFGVREVTISDRDILWGVALEAASG